MPFVDQDVAAQLEGAWVLELVNYAETLKRLGLSPSAATESIGDGVCVYTSPDLPVNRAAGMGLHSPVTTGQMQEMESFFADRKMPAQFDLCPLADPSLLELAAERGYHVVRFLDVLCMDLPSQESLPALPPGVEIRKITADETEIWARAVASGFAATDGLDESDANVVLARAAPPMRPRYGHGRSLPVLRRPMDSTSRTPMSFLHAPPHTVQASSVTWLQSGDSLPVEEP